MKLVHFALLNYNNSVSKRSAKLRAERLCPIDFANLRLFTGADIENGEAQIWRLIFVRQVDVVLVEVEANGKGDKRVRRQWPEKNDPDKS